MEEKTGGESFSDIGDSIARHPWVLLFSFLIIFNIFQAYAGALPPQYYAGAILSFESSAAGSRVVNEKKAAAEKILSGPNIDAIVGQAVADVSPQKKASRYRDLARRLRDPRSGLRFSWESKDAGHLLKIDFGYSDPALCYKTVKATMDMVIDESELKVAREMEANIAFLEGQLAHYKIKIDAIDRETETIREELVKKYPELTDAEKELVGQQSGDVDITKGSAVQKFEMREETVSKLKATLADLQDQRDKLQNLLRSGTFMARYTLDDVNKADPVLEEYSSTINAKELEATSLRSRGYRDEHPHVRQLMAEADQLRELKRSRMGRLRDAVPGTLEYEEAKARLLFDIEELDLKITFVQESLNAAGESRKLAGEQLKSRSTKESDAKKMVSRLAALRSEKAINEQYYGGMKKQLTDAELKYRSEKENAGFKIVVVKEPSTPQKADTSRARGIVFRGLVIALLLGAGLAYLTEKIKDPVRSDKDLAQLLGIPALGSIDRIATAAEISSGWRRIAYGALATLCVIVITRIVIAAVFSGKT